MVFSPEPCCSCARRAALAAVSFVNRSRSAGDGVDVTIGEGGTRGAVCARWCAVLDAVSLVSRSEGSVMLPSDDGTVSTSMGGERQWCALLAAVSLMSRLEGPGPLTGDAGLVACSVSGMTFDGVWPFAGSPAAASGSERWW